MANSRGWRKKAVVTESSASAPREAGEVARVAYELYERRGCLDGHDLEAWLKAEAIVRARVGTR